MNCTWQAGKDEPRDTQYFLYWKKSRYDDATECELYIKDGNGRNTGCVFQNVTIGTEKAYFLVNGSRMGALIHFYETCLYLHEIEKLMPPSNITVSCDEIKHDCIIHWQRPQISHSDRDKCFKYELNIKHKVRVFSSPAFQINVVLNLPGNSYTFPRPHMRKTYVLKMRAAGSYCIVSPNWGEWSAPVVFGK
ncbi:CSF2R factor, partial [Upupa epops]|nr:CSF2R factor [Upupa epops]